MKAIMISVSPETCERVATGACTILVKKSMPKIEEPIKCYLYCTKESKKRYLDHRFNTAIKGLSHHSEMGKVIGEFICDRLIQYNCDRDFEQYFVAGYLGAYMPLREMYLTQKDLMNYGKGKTLYGWHISNLTIYDKPKALGEFYAKCNIPESKCKLCGNCFYREDEFGRGYSAHTLTRPPQSWQYVET